MSDLSDHTVYCIIITGQCQVFSFEWAFFSGPWMWRSYVNPDCMRGMADRVLRLLYMLSFFVVWYLVRAARCRQPIVGGYLGAWIVLLDFSRRSRALHLLLWSIIWYWM